jgi:beta-galactosidase
MKKTYMVCFAVAFAWALLPGSLWSAGLTSEVRMHNGMPALFVNGKLTSQILAAPYRPGPSDFTDFLQAGISIFDIYLRFNWSGPEQYDFKRVDEKLDAYLKLEPRALFLPRVLLTPGPWWREEFPSEITMRDDGSPAGMFGAACHPSLASQKYRELSHKALIAFLNHVEGKYGDHIVGYQAGNGFGGEWLTFNSFWEIRPGGQPPTKFGVEDYSPPAQAAFRRWLKKKYGTVEELRRAWRDSKVTFQTAKPPNEVERYSSTRGIFFDPAVSRRVPDYFTFFNDMVSDVLLENCRWIKEVTRRRKIVGSFYGYLWCNFPNLSVVHSGHLGLAKVLRSPDVNFITSPYTYDNKQIGGPNNSQTLPEAVALHGKLYFNEVDTETHLHQRQWRWGNSLNNPRNWEETKALLIRDYGYALSKGFGMWWTDLHGGTFHDDQIIKLLGDLKKIDERYLEADRRANADIAVVLDEASFTYFGDGEPLFNALLTAQKQWELGFIGAPWEPQLLTDLGNPKLRDYKLYIFLNTFRVTPEQRAAIHARLKRNHATAVWVYAPGYIGEKLSVDNMRELTGIRLAESDSAGELHVDITSYEHPYTNSLPEGFAYGTDVNVANIIRWYDHQIYLKDPRDPSLRRDLPGFRINPRFWSDDAEATVLGRLAGLGKPGLVVKKLPGWISVYSSAPILPAALLRNVARATGCHIYSDANDVVYANRNFLCVYAPGGGTRTIHLPHKAKVIDLLENRTVAGQAAEFPLTLEANSSVLFSIESAEQ